MAKDIMEHVRFLQIVKLVGTADEIARYESPIGEMVEKHFVGNQAWHRHHSPSSGTHQPFRQFFKVRNTRLGKAKHVQPAQIRLACAAGQQCALPREQPVPRSEEHTSELQSLMRISYAVFCLKKKIKNKTT